MPSYYLVEARRSKSVPEFCRAVPDEMFLKPEVRTIDFFWGQDKVVQLLTCDDDPDAVMMILLTADTLWDILGCRHSLVCSLFHVRPGLQTQAIRHPD